MSLNDRVVVIGAGVFGLSTAVELSNLGYKDIVVLDRHVPPVPDGSSVDISRIIRFDYADAAYTRIAKEAYESWSTPEYVSSGIFYPTPFILAANAKNARARSWIDRCITQLEDSQLPYERLDSISHTKALFPALSGPLIHPDFYGYCNRSAGWADAAKGIVYFRNLCIEKGISFISGAHGTVTGFDQDAHSNIVAARTANGHKVEGKYFVLAAGAWSNKLVPMYNSTLATAQVLGYVKLTPEEVLKLKNMPVYVNMETGWFIFPPHEDTGLLKCAVHGWGYTRSETEELSSPVTTPRSERVNFAPADGVQRLKDGMKQVFPDIAQRGFDRTAVCWYNDTPTGDFIVDYHPDYPNLLVTTGGSGHAYKFLPVLGKYTAKAFTRTLPEELAQKWSFKTGYKSEKDVFAGDGSRAGPERREFTFEEKAKL